jgi:hypothetical protein
MTTAWAVAIATEAGRRLLALRRDLAGDAEALKAEGDLQSHRYIVTALAFS